MQYHIFLSYSRKDADIMHRIRNDLQSAGLIVWNDENLTPGTPSWKNAIEVAIENTANLIVILSPNAKQSEWIERELDYAETCGVRVIPLLAHGDERNSIPFELINVQRVDIRTDYESGMQQLIATIRESIAVIDNSSPQGTTHADRRLSRHSVTPEDDLDAWNLLDQLRLMQWVFLEPDRLLRYQMQAGDKSATRIAAWLVSSLAWLPIGVPTLAYTLGTIQRINSAQSGLFFAWILLIMGWFVTAWLAGRDDRRSGFAAFVAAACITLAIFFLVGGVAGVELTAGVVDRADITSALGVAFGVGFVVAKNAVGIASGNVVGMILFIVMLNKPLGLESGGLAAVALIGVTLAVATTLRRSCKNGQLSVFNWLVAGMCAVIYGLMIWIYFLGGWSVLAR